MGGRSPSWAQPGEKSGGGAALTGAGEWPGQVEENWRTATWGRVGPGGKSAAVSWCREIRRSDGGATPHSRSTWPGGGQTSEWAASLGDSGPATGWEVGSGGRGRGLLRCWDRAGRPLCRPDPLQTPKTNPAGRVPTQPQCRLGDKTVGSPDLPGSSGVVPTSDQDRLTHGPRVGFSRVRVGLILKCPRQSCLTPVPSCQALAAAPCPTRSSAPSRPRATCTRWSFTSSGQRRPGRSSRSTEWAAG